MSIEKVRLSNFCCFRVAFCRSEIVDLEIRDKNGATVSNVRREVAR